MSAGVLSPYAQKLCSYLRGRLDAKTVEIEIPSPSMPTVRFRVTLRKDPAPYTASLEEIMRRHGIQRIPEDL